MQCNERRTNRRRESRVKRPGRRANNKNCRIDCRRRAIGRRPPPPTIWYVSNWKSWHRAWESARADTLSTVACSIPANWDLLHVPATVGFSPERPSHDHTITQCPPPNDPKKTAQRHRPDANIRPPGVKTTRHNLPFASLMCAFERRKFPKKQINRQKPEEEKMQKIER